MTSNMTMTAISICNFLKLIVKSTVEHYTEDFKLDIKIFKRYAKEAQETGKPVSMLWFCRSCGTYLCPEEDAYKKDTPMFITFKYYDEQEEEEARTIKAFLVTVTGMEGQKPVGYITPINYADECDRIRRYAVPAEKVELVYDKGSLVQNNGNYTILKLVHFRKRNSWPMTLTRLIMRCIWLAMRERQSGSHENDGYIDSRRSPKLFGVRSDLRNDGRSLLEFRTPSQTIQQDVYRSRTEADSPHQSHCSQMVFGYWCS